LFVLRCVSKMRNNEQIDCHWFLSFLKGQILRGPKTASRESVGAGEAVLMPCQSPHGPGSRPSTTATSSNFEISSSSYEDNTTSVTGECASWVYMVHFVVV
jgi:hypothetical protein